MQSSTTCSIPAAALAYSLNITVVPQGPIGFLTAYPTGQSLPLAATLVWSQGSITSNAAIVPAGTSGSINVYASNVTDLVIDINGYYAAPTDLNGNTAIGAGTLANNTTGSLGNTAIGNIALSSNTTGNLNTAMGDESLRFNTTGGNNTAIGHGALFSNLTGSNNIAIGMDAAINVSGGNSRNIHIGNAGSFTDSGTIRIGTSGTQTSFYVAGVNGVTTTNSAVPVLIDTTTGQLGVTSSSRRYKEDIQDMGDASSGLMRLRPVTFRYQKPFADGSKPIQYGLIAEEVAKVYPDLVAHSADGQIEAVKYQVLDSMLLNEVQRLSKENQALQERLSRLEATMASVASGAGVQ
jgi:hypothetical protein